MASYLSYFTSNTSSSALPTSQGSTWSNTFSSRIATLRKALTKDSEEDDPDNEDCSHISNVLRAYYTEKGRPLPEWLPPDPKKPIAPPPPAQPQGAYGQYGNNNIYGSQFGNQQPHSRGSSGGRGAGLSDLWDPAPAPAPVAAPPQSLRAARPTPQALRSNDLARSQSSGGSQIASFGGPAPAPRPLPSQRAGSHQISPAPNTQALGSRERLRARLQAGGSGRSSPSSGLGGAGSGGQASYGPSGGSINNPNRSGSSQPYISASEPWSTGGDPYAYDGGYASSGLSSTQYAGQDSRQRPGGPR
ncbi:hypothetical protein LTR10_022779 [Elasticomyces elasticus]|uniref:Mso1 N-terminal domain-containing protein n=1 Tax=Exophiala sideris TaxID=1016849 RepID=A0ABR0JMS5_9EURO|nr:hypothetical protein LTR10_022779 [Elasticomyces elasticus]KAK5036594.1 hypothetical protein LTS07_002321 [Exophiala sideris]KAK5041575.1 hypothetical protein LTR13_002242 [Exophiala sideris]KAK5066977.1 hypothetical protein LTR69_002325 [Exophiala sideris]KAK5185036.1 hypothetical protein LTR44_002882 [Eurotiomycetes sp. CCFEE 6388]